MVYTVNMKQEAIESLRVVRRHWLNQGMDVARTAKQLGITKQAVSAAVRRINAADPLYWGEGEPEDQRALQRAARLALTARGIRWRSPLTELPEGD